jgi:hypothetical protein
MNVPAIIDDFEAIGGTLRKGPLDEWSQLAKPKPGSKADLRGKGRKATDSRF